MRVCAIEILHDDVNLWCTRICQQHMTRARKLRVVADDLRKKAREPGDLAYRARLVILAEQYEELARTLDTGAVH